LAEFYAKLKNSRDVKTFIILGPDHVDGGRGDISVSKADFSTPFGSLEPNLEIIESLENSGFVIHDETPFDQEHSIHSQLLFIGRLFPDAKIVPLVFRSSATNGFARAFGSVMSEYLDENVFIVASVDFTHYLSEEQARPIDELSGSILSAINAKSAGLIESDSPQSLSALVSALEEKQANDLSDLGIFNTADFSDNQDYTTGYVTGFWGIRGEVAGQVHENNSEKGLKAD